MRRGTIAIVILALSWAQGPVAAEPDTDTDLRLPELLLPADAVTATRVDGSLQVRAPGLRLEDLLVGSVDPRDVRTHPDVMRAFIEASTGLQLPDLRPDHSSDRASPLGARPDLISKRLIADPEDTSGVEGSAESGTILYAMPGGDLNGDGKDDVLIFELTLPEDEMVLRAVRGTNASQLWELDLDAADAIPYPVDDMTGDGIDDLLLYEFHVIEETEVEDCPDELNCHYQYDATYDWIVGLRSGANGKRLWSTAYAGEDHYAFVRETEDSNPPVSQTERYEERYESPNYVVFPNVSGDHDGDGLDDLVLQELDLDFLNEAEYKTTAEVVEEGSGSSHLHTATRATVTRGRDGSRLLTRAMEMGPGVTRLQPVGNLTGTSTPDLLWNEEILGDSSFACLGAADTVEECTDDPEYDFNINLELLDGDTLASAWDTTIDDIDDGFVVYLGEDLSGDSVDDILAFAFLPQENPYVQRLVSGTDGAILWERTQAADVVYWDFPVAFGELTGDGKTDLVLGNFAEISESPLATQDAARFTRVNGLTGQTISETTRPFAQALNHELVQSILYISGMDDVDEDGTGEGVAGYLAAGYDRDTLSGEYTRTEVISSAFVESGEAATTLYANSGADLFSISPAGELDGDGKTEAFEWHYPLEEGGDYELVALRLIPSKTLWTRTMNEDEAWHLWPAGDQDGGPGQELLTGRNDLLDGHWSSFVASLKGSNGSERWRIET
ncbi:MAG: hypothetical protein ACRDH9_06080 [Actinomycetota bacterium]